MSPFQKAKYFTLGYITGIISVTGIIACAWLLLAHIGG